MCAKLVFLSYNSSKQSLFISRSLFFFEVSKKELQLVILQINTLQKA